MFPLGGFVPAVSLLRCSIWATGENSAARGPLSAPQTISSPIRSSRSPAAQRNQSFPYRSRRQIHHRFDHRGYRPRSHHNLRPRGRQPSRRSRRQAGQAGEEDPSATTTRTSGARSGSGTRWSRARTRANCIAACSWDDVCMWTASPGARNERRSTNRTARTCTGLQTRAAARRSACYGHLLSEARIGTRWRASANAAKAKWKRVSWEALTEVADKLIDASAVQGTSPSSSTTVSTNAGYGPETAGTCVLPPPSRRRASTHRRRRSGCRWVDPDLGLYNCEGTSDDWYLSDFIVIWVGKPDLMRIPGARISCTGALPRRG